MLLPPRSSPVRWLRLALPFLLAVIAISVRAQSGARSTGTLEGRVLNATSGSYLNNARVTIAGTTLETATDENGAFRFPQVPAGEARVTATFAGMPPQSAVVAIAAGGLTRHEFELQLGVASRADKDGVLVLDKFTVQATELTAQAIALHERRTAPNIKNVVAIENDIGEGNVGELLKAIPGIAEDLNPQSPASASIRGMPASGTVVMTDGAEVASASVSGRTVDLGLAATGNLDRLEVSKVPTPDMPANAVGGSINMISKSSFSRRKPLLTYSVFLTATTRDGYRNSGLGNLFGNSEGDDPKSNMSRINPAFNLSYLYPLSPTLGLTLSLSRSERYTDWDFRRPTWDKVRGIKTSEITNALPFGEGKLLGAAKVDWRVGRHQLTASGSYSTQDIFTRQFQLTTNFGAGVTGGPMFSQGTANGVGTVTQQFAGNNQDKRTYLVSVSDRYSGQVWNFDASVSFSYAQFEFSDLDGGFFGAVNATLSNLVLRQQYINPDESRLGYTTATTRTGAPVDIYNGRLFTVNSMSTTAQTIEDTMKRAGLNVSRDLDGGFPLRLKTGAAVTIRHNDTEGGANSWTFVPPGGTNAQSVEKYDLIGERFSSLSRFKDIYGNPVKISYISSTKLKSLFDQHPDWFLFNPSNAHTNTANGTKEIDETISAAYVRADVRRFQNRLWLVAGVRYERTDDEGAGVLNDIRRTFRQDAKGNLILDAAGRPIKVSTDALELAKAQYTIKGARSKNHYDGYYPSANASYHLTPNVVARAAYAKTIGRPNFPDVIPGLTITDPNSATHTITAVSGALKPWTADNYDLSLELYEKKGATASVSAFRKDITGFFVTTRNDATPEALAGFGLDENYLSYDIVTKRNGGDARVDGIELEYRQALWFLPQWARGFQVFGNATKLELSGSNANDFTGFTSKTGNWGLSFTRPRFTARVAVNYTGLRRVAVSGTNSYTYYAPQTRIDASASYMFTRHYVAFMDVRNLAGVPLRRGTWNNDTPPYARIDQYQYAGAQFTLGLRGQF